MLREQGIRLVWATYRSEVMFCVVREEICDDCLEKKDCLVVEEDQGDTWFTNDEMALCQDCINKKFEKYGVSDE